MALVNVGNPGPIAGASLGVGTRKGPASLFLGNMGDFNAFPQP